MLNQSTGIIPYYGYNSSKLFLPLLIINYTKTTIYYFIIFYCIF